MQTVIIAGGLGMRIRSLAPRVPKSLMPIHGKPFLAYQLDWLATHGLRDVLVCVGHLGEQIEAFAQDGRTFGMRIRYAREGDRLLGTAGALKRAEAWLEDRFVVLNGDSYLPINPLEPIRRFEAAQVPAMMLVFHNQSRFDRSNAEVRDGLVTAYDRQADAAFEWIDYGLRIFAREVLHLIPSGTRCDLDVLYQRLIERRQLAAFTVTEPFYEVGSPEGVARFERYVETTARRQLTSVAG